MDVHGHADIPLHGHKEAHTLTWTHRSQCAGVQLEAIRTFLIERQHIKRVWIEYLESRGHRTTGSRERTYIHALGCDAGVGA